MEQKETILRKRFFSSVLVFSAFISLNTYAKVTQNYESTKPINSEEIANSTKTNKQKSAQVQNLKTDFEKGLYYYNENDYKQAFYWFQKSAKQGNARAQFNVALMYHKGQGVTQSYEQALHWYQEVAKQGVQFMPIYQIIMQVKQQIKLENSLLTRYIIKAQHSANDILNTNLTSKKPEF